MYQFLTRFFGLVCILTPLFAFTPTDALAVCGSRGGPGYRLSNGKCASWRDAGGSGSHHSISSISYDTAELISPESRIDPDTSRTYFESRLMRLVQANDDGILCDVQNDFSDLKKYIAENTIRTSKGLSERWNRLLERALQCKSDVTAVEQCRIIYRSSRPSNSSGNCMCRDDVGTNGRCGETSAEAKLGGATPVCRENDPRLKKENDLQSFLRAACTYSKS